MSYRNDVITSKSFSVTPEQLKTKLIELTYVMTE